MEDKKYFSFEVDHQYFAVPIEVVNRIIGIQDITTIPRQPDYVKGVINLRGQIVPIVDFRLRMGLPGAPYNDRTTIIITERDNIFIGYIVDDVNEVLTINTERVSVLSETKKETRETELIWGYFKTDEMIIKLLDFDNLTEK